MPTNRSTSRGTAVRRSRELEDSAEYEYEFDNDVRDEEPERYDRHVAARRPRTAGSTQASRAVNRPGSARAPLAASSNLRARRAPAAEGTGFAAWFRRASRTYGWRIYAVPVLLVITVMVVVDATNPVGGPTQLDGSSGVNAAGQPAATEVPANQADLNIPTAELPAGGPVTQQGKGTWHIVPGAGPRVGKTGKLYRYTVEVEDGIDPVQYGGDSSFSTMIDQTLDDPKSWTGTGQISVQRVDASTPNPDFRISLTTPGTDHRGDLCGFDIKYESSCYRSSAGRVVISLARWVRGAKAFSGDMLTYRQYAINHEVGHAFGNHHVGCAKTGGLAPVMMQQSFGVANNYVAKLNEVDPSNRSAVPADGKTCVPNAWPDPEAKPSSG